MVLAATGHRPPRLGGYQDTIYNQLVGLARMYLAALQPETAVSGMALGWDQAFAQAAYDLGIPFIAALPHPRPWINWPQQAQNRYASILSKCCEQVTVCREYDKGVFKKRDIWMVDSSDMLLALYDGGGKSGTSMTIDYARSVGKDVINTWGVWEVFRNELQ